jgi:DNA primase
MAKVSPVSIKYMIYANFSAEGALEKPDVIGAVFGQTEGLLGNDLEMRELQKEGKIGRIEVELERSDKRTTGEIKIPTALDQSETALIAAAIETIERIGPCDSHLEITKIEDVRGTKRDYIIDRAKKLMKDIEGSTDSREISNTVKDSAKMSSLQEYGDEKLSAGDVSGEEIIVVEGRADVLNLMRNGIDNVISMNGTKLPEAVRELSKNKKVTLFVDGDRGGKLIIKNVLDNAQIDFIAIAPDGKEVEELAGKELLMNLRKRMSVSEYLAKERQSERFERNGYSQDYRNRDNREYRERTPVVEKSSKEFTEADKDKLRKISGENYGTGKAVLLNEKLEEIKSVSAKSLSAALKRVREKPYAIVVDGTATPPIIQSAEESGCKIVVAKNFTSTNTSLTLLSL